MKYREASAAMHCLEMMRRFQARHIMMQTGLHPGQPPLLKTIWDHPGCTQKDAADELDVTPASIASSIKRLEKAGLVARTPHQQDARRNCLTITQEGLNRLQTGLKAFDALDQQMYSGLTEDEVIFFQRICEKMFDNLADESCRHLNVFKLAKRLQEEMKEEKEE